MNFIDQITNYIIRPNRERYHINRLGSRQICIPVAVTASRDMTPDSKCPTAAYPYISIFRDDYSILTREDRALYYSYYTNHMAQYPDLCVIYLHANNGSRVEGLHYLDYLFKCRYNVCLIDFAGSGWSEGEYVTLGCNESRDLEAVCRHIREIKGINHVVLWGRSMGACTALMFASKFSNSGLIGMVLDSPFKDLRKLVKQTAKQKTGLPEFFFQPILSFVDNQLQKRIGHRFQQYQMQQYIPLTKAIIPTLFISSQLDKLVKPHHVETLYEMYPGIPQIDKFLYYIQNEHHQDRDQEAIHKCIEFINKIVNKYFNDASGRRVWQRPPHQKQCMTLFLGCKDQQKQQRYSLKTQRLVNESNLMRQKQDAISSFFQCNPSTNPSMILSLGHPRQMSRQKQKRRRGLGIQLTEKFHNEYSEWGKNGLTKRLSQPGSRSPYEEQRISLTKNIKVRMNQSYQSGAISPSLTGAMTSARYIDKKSQVSIDSARMIESYRENKEVGKNSVNMVTNKKVNLSEFKSPRDNKFEQYYSLGRRNGQQYQNQTSYWAPASTSTINASTSPDRNTNTNRNYHPTINSNPNMNPISTMNTNTVMNANMNMNMNTNMNMNIGTGFDRQLEYDQLLEGGRRYRWNNQSNLNHARSQHDLANSYKINAGHELHAPFSSTTIPGSAGISQHAYPSVPRCSANLSDNRFSPLVDSSPGLMKARDGLNNEQNPSFDCMPRPGVQNKQPFKISLSKLSVINS